MKVLVACEESQRVTAEFRKLGHEAYSCDIEPCSGGHPEWHIHANVLPLLNGDCGFHTADGTEHRIDGEWDMLIAFPPCTHLAVSGARYFEEKRKDGRQQKGIDFFMQFVNADCRRIAIENPVGIMSRRYRRPDQIIQPWMFGDMASKRTCLWLKNLDCLVPDTEKEPELEYVVYGKNRKMQKWMYEVRGKTLKNGYRAKLASKTFPGIARAMAEQWGGQQFKGNRKGKKMDGLYKGYVETKNKKCVEKFKDRTDFKTLEQVQSLPEYAGILAKNTMFIDIDDPEQSEILMDIVEAFQLDCRVICTSRGKHFIFRNTQLHQCKTHTRLAIGLAADIKVGYVASYEVLKTDGEERFCEWDVEPGVEYQEVPKWLLPVRCKMDFLNMEAGDGRNQELFNYILTLQSNDYSVEETREAIRIINRFVLKDPLSDQEIETILRDDAFKKPVFFNGPKFLFDRFAAYMKNTHHVVLINGNLHIYRDGVYEDGYRAIEAEMIRIIPDLSDAKRKEVLKYMNLICDRVQPADARYIAFRNGIYDVATDTMQDFSPNIVMTNKIPWDYNSAAFSELADNTLNRLACDDPAIRSLLEECIGYCFYRRNELGKAFILTGDKNNGKSTFLEVVKAILHDSNISALDAKELGDRFTTSMMFGKLANIGDDISDDFMQGSQVSIFKKIVTGNRIKAERKGQDPFEFNPYIKLLFSANDIPRMKDKTGAVLRRLVIIPFNATFTKEDPNYDAFIKYKLVEQESVEYLIRLGLAGLRRVLENQGFTNSEKVDKQLEEYEEENNPIVAFIHDQENGEADILNETTEDVYARYKVFCNAANMQPMSKIVFSKQINKRLKTEAVPQRIAGKSKLVKVYRKI